MFWSAHCTPPEAQGPFCHSEIEFRDGIQELCTTSLHFKHIWDLFEWKVLSGERAMSSEKSPSCSGPLSLTAVGRPWNWITPSLSIMQIDPAHGGRAEQSASCWFCASCSPFVQPINVSAVRKGSRGGLFNTKSIEPFSAFLSRWTSWYFWGDFDSLASLQCTSLKISLLKGSRIDKEKTESCREGWWQFCARLIDVCAPPPPCQLDPLTASLQISYLDQPLPCGSPPLT